jgi:hypothetical protein
MEAVTTTVGALQVGDRLILPESPRNDLRPVEITRLQPLPRSGRIRIWVISIHQQRSMLSAWNYGAFDPSHEIEQLVEA